MRWEADRAARDILDGLPDGVLVVDRAARIRYANARAGEMFLREPEELVGTSVHELVPARAREHHVEHVRAAFESPVQRQMSMQPHLVAVRADGTEFPVDVALRPMGAFYLATIRDTEEVRRLRAELALQSRMSQLGLLAAVVAHEVNNPLSLVLGNLELAAEEIEPGHPAAELLAEAHAGALVVRDVVRDFLELGRPGDPGGEVTVDLADVVRMALRLAGSQLRRHGVVEVESAAVRVRGNRAALVQVMLNLLTNAIQATSGRPVLPRIEVGCARVGGRGAFWVRDNGRGLTPEVRSRLFTPFFTTRREGGNGLGLYLCDQIVRELRGEIVVSGAPDQGAEFRVLLQGSDTDN